MLTDMGGWRVVGEAVNGCDAIELCQDHSPDVVLLDIRMPGMDGLEVATHLCQLEAPPAVIFTTAYDEYAVTAFETYAVGYLLKPVRRERLLRALEHAARLGQMKLAQLAQAELGNVSRKRIPVTQAGKLQLIPSEQVIAFRADHKYVPLKDLEEEFAHEFVRVHRNSLVRASRIVAMEKKDGTKHEITLHGYPARLPVSRRHYASLKQRLQG